MKKLPDAHFEKLTSAQAEHVARFGMKDETVPYGYTTKLTNQELAELNVLNWGRTAELIAEGNERLYLEAKEK